MATENELTDSLLAQCASEPIHVPGSIQPHGLLVAFEEPGFEVRYASAGADVSFGVAHDGLLGRDFRVVLDAFNRDQLTEALRSRFLEDANEALRLQLNGVAYRGALHRHANLVMLEMESQVASTDSNAIRLDRIFRRLQQATTTQELLDIAVGETRELTGCDRVVAYHFDADGHGKVLAEARADDMQAYLGLHFPASDIPAQARDLYRRSWLRAIPDVDYVAVPVLSDGERPPLDMTYSVLRSVSPVHREYMRNMGLGASMSISLIHDETLWGLISCGHRTPLHFSPEVRSACISLGRLLSVQIAALDGLREIRLERAKDNLLAPLVDAMKSNSSEVLAGLAANPDHVLKLVGASGAAVLIDKSVHLYGDCPSTTDVSALTAWALRQLDASGCFATSRLPDAYPAAESFSEIASGVIVMGLPKPVLNAVAWFRPEVSKTVAWAGEPVKTIVQADAASVQRLSPRHSFGEWKTTVSGQSSKWGSDDLYAVTDLRRSAIEIDLGAQVSRALDAVASREELVAVMSHDLRSPLSVVVLQAAMLLRTFTADPSIFSRRVLAATHSVQKAAARMTSMLDDLLDMALIEKGRYGVAPVAVEVEHLFDDANALLRPIADGKGISLTFATDPGLKVMADAERFYQVISNLVGNAIKFTSEDGYIAVKATRSAKASLIDFTVTDNGIGMAPDVIEHIFDRYWKIREGNPTGSGLGLNIARGVIEAHGGTIEVSSRLGAGTTFVFTLPNAPA